MPVLRLAQDKLQGHPGYRGVETEPRFPKFTNEVQLFLDKVLQWDDAMNRFRLKSAVRFPDLAKLGKQSAKSRQLWIARHRL
jgi:hypothetical protein